MRAGIGRVGSVAGLLALAACGRPGGDAASESADVAAVEIIAPTPASSPAAAEAGSPVAAPRIAYVHRWSLELPADRVSGVMRAHEAACAAAGPTVCRVASSNVVEDGRDSRSARLQFEATPAYVDRFRGGLDAEARGAGGRVTSTATESEDLSRQIIDAEARLRALTTLRDRLEGLLATRAAPLDQLLQTERELARVQGELDAARAILRHMQGRVAMSTVTVAYDAEGGLAPDDAFAPVASALQNALRVFMMSVAGLVLILAGLLPVAAVIAPIVWLSLKRRRARRAEAARLKQQREADLNPQPEA